MLRPGSCSRDWCTLAALPTQSTTFTRLVLSSAATASSFTAAVSTLSAWHRKFARSMVSPHVSAVTLAASYRTFSLCAIAAKPARMFERSVRSPTSASVKMLTDLDSPLPLSSPSIHAMASLTSFRSDSSMEPWRKLYCRAFLSAAGTRSTLSASDAR